MQGFYEGKLHPWDVAADKFIATVSGAKIGNYSDDPNSSIPDCINGDKAIVSSPGVFNEFQRLLVMKII